MNTTPIINPFMSPYKIWSFRKPTREEQLELLRSSEHLIMGRIQDRLLKIINSPLEAALHISENSDNELPLYIENYLENSPEFANWINHMPSQTPELFRKYQEEYPISSEELSELKQEICKIGFELPEGQVLFHGGQLHFSYEGGLQLDRPLSTTFCPKVAFDEQDHNYKAFSVKERNIYAININSNGILAFVYGIEGNSFLKHEKEVLLAGNIRLILKNKYRIRDSLATVPPDSAEAMPTKTIQIPTYICEVDAISSK